MKFPLSDEHGFHGPEEAAFHATAVQGGFSTPRREAARMLLGGGAGELRAREWMDAQHLTADDLEWDSGKLAHWRSTVPGLCFSGDHRLCLVPDPARNCPGFIPPS